MTHFSDLGLAEPILRAVSSQGYDSPTPIQQQVIPAMLAGKDVLGTAQTGTGKTAAFVLPILHALSTEKTRVSSKGCRALIMAPTRELAMQIVDSVRTYGEGSRISVTLVVGGLKINKQIKAMERGVDIVVATPGRLLDLAQQRAIRFDDVKMVVLDEADHMMDMGFLPQIKKVLVQLPKQRQTALLSATMPTDIRKLADQFLKNPVNVAVSQESKPVERIDQSVRFVPHAQKRDVLTEILKGPKVDSAIVFTRTKRGADRVCRHLEQAGLTAAAIHGNKSQNQRTKALDLFKAKKLTVLVATDIAARGIDIDQVSHVVNYELPNVPESYVHRIGRTARAGESGTAITLCDGEERKLLRDIEKLIGNRLPGNEAGAAEEPINDKESKNFHPSKDGQRRRKPRSGNRAGNSGGHQSPKRPKQRSHAS
ncbi:DEAD/DEAH box helicase [Henriciella litoralis]|uniref:DEAD/DEAH box helicase n=1 Tax=Henriciella litoralis TaxID=568102 RepID=UPI000A060235|nr:DEAD/DEAH box helicase [Henriciella litoralis]